MEPTFEGFKVWVATVMGVTSDNMPSDALLQTVYDFSLNWVLDLLRLVPSQPTSASLYASAVYNLGGHFLVLYAMDTPPSTFWQDLRNRYQIGSMKVGLIQSASDQGSSTSYMIPEQLQNMTLADLMMMQTPWGQAYLMIASGWGNVWGITA